MRYFVVELFCFFYPLFILSQNKAEVDISFHSNDVKKVSPFLFGNFIEYYMCFQNGNSGMWAQELFDRGFDIKYMDRGVSDSWETWSSHYSEDEKWELVKGGFNQNAIYLQRLTKKQNESKLGIRQHIYTTENVGYDFYVYLRGDSTINDVKIRIMDLNLIDVITEVSLGKPDAIWKKHTAKIPEIKDRGQVILIICYQDSGTLELDEASLMPENNVDGIRKEYYDIFNEWKPTILRYPGGWFVEYSGYRWEMGIGNIDKRAVFPTYEAVRMDFGIDEFLKFCDDFDIEPHLVTNFLEGSPEESASLVEYCNGDISSKYGSLRVSNGHVEPYNVKIWEIGNEIWDHPYDYATGFVNFYDKMKEKDQSIECIISADVWQWKPFFDTLVDITKDNCEYYGWHWTQLAYPKVPVTDENMYLSMVGASFETENNIDSVHKWIAQKGLSNNMNQAITEIWSSYNPDAFEWTHDTTTRGASLENGLWMATQNNACLKKSDKVKIVEKTFAVATLRIEIDSNTNKRHFYKTPSYWACSMLRNHVGNELLPTIVNCDKYSQSYFEGLVQVSEIPWVDVVSTKSKDSVFISIINRHPQDTIHAHFNFDSIIPFTLANVYELSSKYYLDHNSIDEPNKVIPKQKSWAVSKTYNMPPHSFTILAIPINGIIKVDESSISQKFDYTVNPNPVIDLLKITANSEIENIKIYNILGKLVFEEFVQNNQASINLDNLPNGLYVIDIQNKKTTFIKN